MRSILSILIAVFASATILTAAAPSPETIQGLYEGIWKGNNGTAKVEVRCVALGDDKYRVLTRHTENGEIQRLEATVSANDSNGRVSFTGRIDGQDSKVLVNGKTVKGTIGKVGSFQAKRIQRTSPTLGKKAPANAVVLIDGENFDNMKPGKGEWLPTNKADGSIQVPKGGMRSVPKFGGSFNAHVEFMCPLEPKKRGQGRGNSGCYLPCGKEIQVLESFGTGTYIGGGCGGLYRYKNPDTMGVIPSMKDHKEGLYNLASLPPLEWQTYDIEYRVTDGGKALLTVYHNGIKIHDGVSLQHKAGTFHFQDHSNPVRYRNIWVENL